MSIEGKTIICFASGYDAPPTSKHHVMHLLAKTNQVLWVNYHASRMPTATSSDMSYLFRKLAQVAGGMTNPRPNLHVLTPLVLPIPSSTLARRVNRMLLTAQLRLAIDRIETGGERQVWTFTPDISYLLGTLGEKKVVYYCVDDFAEFSGYDKAQVLADEADLCSRADLVITTSSALLTAKRGMNANTMLVLHGVDYAHFRGALDDLPCPADLASIPQPRLGFFGLIRDWVDVEMMHALARRRPDWHIVMIGDSKIDLSALGGLANLHFLGPRKYAELPAYCRHFSAGLIPFKVNQLTHAVNPIKLREYLAAGLPVVSSPMPEVAAQPGSVWVAGDVEAWEAGVTAALAVGPAGRRELCDSMKDQTWEGKLRQIEDALRGAVCPTGVSPMRPTGVSPVAGSVDTPAAPPS